MRKTFIIVTILVLLGVIAFYLFKKPLLNNTPIEETKSEIINSVVFNCAENKNIQAIFFKDKVELTLSDGRNMLIPQAISASGARYANSDESFIFWNKGDTAFIDENGEQTFKECIIPNTENTDASVSVANPASLNCIKQGGTLKIEKNGAGSEYGLCYFEENRACEEWALMNGNCPVGGRKTTGFDTIDQNYCAWSGGETLATKNSVCTLKSGQKCSTLDFYNGKCPVPVSL